MVAHRARELLNRYTVKSCTQGFKSLPLRHLRLGCVAAPELPPGSKIRSKPLCILHVSHAVKQ